MRRWQLGLTLMACVLVTACSPVKLASVSTYSLSSLKKPVRRVSAKTQLTLNISAPSASAGYRTANLIYMMTPYQLSSFALHQWVAPPAQMMLPILVEAIRAKGFYKAVIGAPYSGKTNFTLGVQLLKLQQEFLLPKSRVRMDIQANLFNNRTGVVVASQRFSALVVARSNTPYGGVLAANQAVTQLSQQIAAFCVRYSR